MTTKVCFGSNQGTLACILASKTGILDGVMTSKLPRPPIVSDSCGDHCLTLFLCDPSAHRGGAGEAAGGGVDPGASREPLQGQSSQPGRQGEEIKHPYSFLTFERNKLDSTSHYFSLLQAKYIKLKEDWTVILELLRQHKERMAALLVAQKASKPVGKIHQGY